MVILPILTRALHGAPRGRSGWSGGRAGSTGAAPSPSGAPGGVGESDGGDRQRERVCERERESDVQGEQKMVSPVRGTRGGAVGEVGMSWAGGHGAVGGSRVGHASAVIFRIELCSSV